MRYFAGNDEKTVGECQGNVIFFPLKLNALKWNDDSFCGISRKALIQLHCSQKELAANWAKLRSHQAKMVEKILSTKSKQILKILKTWWCYVDNHKCVNIQLIFDDDTISLCSHISSIYCIIWIVFAKKRA